MPHLSNNPKVLKRVRRLIGQMQGVERMLNAEADCYQVLQTVAACRGSLNALTKELITEHIEHHLIEHPDATKEVQAVSREVQQIISSYLK